VSKDKINQTLRKLPGVDRLLESDRGKKLIEQHGKPAATSALRHGVESTRRKILEGGEFGATTDKAAMENAAINEALENLNPRLRPVINATGVVVHTNLGRAPLAHQAAEAMRSVADVYSNLEYNLEKGERGSRQSIVEGLITELVGSESAMVVNNNAGAVFLALIALAQGREVIVSRGELVEIGGSFRVPDIMAASGAKMMEVGATNKTRIGDYAAAVGPNTAALLKVHRSNFYIRGFTHDTTIEELAALAADKNLYLVVDLGSGCLVDTARWGLPHEPTPQETLKQGAQLVTFSGDKLLGGPQAGIIAGRSDLVGILRKHPVHRAMRVDKCTLAALEATFRLYIAGKAEESVPVLKMISLDAKTLKRHANNIARSLREELKHLSVRGFEVKSAECLSKVGGGALAEGDIPSWAVTIEHGDFGPEHISKALVNAAPPIVGRIQDDKLLLDVRTLWNVAYRDFCKLIASALKSIKT